MKLWMHLRKQYLDLEEPFKLISISISDVNQWIADENN